MSMVPLKLCKKNKIDWNFFLQSKNNFSEINLDFSP